MDKPEALRMADELSKSHLSYYINHAAAAELRRLSIENDALGLHLSERMNDLSRVEAQRDALLEALKEVVAFTGAHGGPYAKARAAIAAAEEEGK